jgi:sec-independent protein translocase protein TatB
MNFGMSEMIFIFIAALILVGPKKLPEILRQVGKFMNEFKRASNEFKYQMESELHNLERETERAKQTILPPTLMAAAAPPQGTIANGALVEAPHAEALTDDLASTSLSDPPSSAPEPAKSVDA